MLWMEKDLKHHDTTFDYRQRIGDNKKNQKYVVQHTSRSLVKIDRISIYVSAISFH